MENNSKEDRLVRIEGQDVKVGEISTSIANSVEGMTEEVTYSEPMQLPHNPTAAVRRSSVNSNNVNSISNNTCDGSGTRVLTMKDGYGYQIARKSLYSNFHNLAWSHGVNNKSLAEVLVMMKSGFDENANANCENDGIREVENIDVKEDGELEEGEIGTDFDLVMKSQDSDTVITNAVLGDHAENGVIKMCELVDALRKELENLNINDAEKSFNKMYSCVDVTVNSLLELILENPFAEKDAFVDVLLAALKKLQSVFCSMTLEFKVQRKATFSRLVGRITNLKPPFFSPQQLKEIENISTSIKMVADSSVNIAKSGICLGLKPDVTDSHMLPERTSDLSLMNNCEQENASVLLSCATENLPIPCAESVLIKPRNRELSVQLLDVHKDHDEDSLPSPTSRISDPLPFKNGLFMENGVKSECPTRKQRRGQGKSVVHPYETDALKAVSSYQQKFVHKSFSMSDKLPSPTPSEEGDSKEDGDINGEVSSSIFLNTKPRANDISPVASFVCSPIDANSCTRTDNTQVPSVGSKSEKPVSKFSLKSRDPRLRMACMEVDARKRNPTHSSSGSLSSNSLGMEVSKKQNSTDDILLDGPASKRQRIDLSGLKTTFPLVTAVSNYPVSSLTISLPVSDPYTCQSDKVAVSNSSGTAPLHSLLTELAGNPSTWNNILKMMSPNSSDDVQIKTPSVTLNPIQGAVPQVSSSDPSTSLPVKISGEVVPNPQKGITANNRMKPRDPRRILQNGGSQKSTNEKPNENTSSSSVIISNLSSARAEDQLEKSVSPSDITKQFVNHLQNTGDISASPLHTETPLRPIQSLGAGVLEGGKVKKDKFSTPEASILAASQPPNSNAWSNYEQLFEGYNDQQKAAIQKERARRLDEQNKMFSARKLCLVLDLDHTLLNSAMFSEVDPVHDEILRRKEDQDRDKTHRHLFRFPHMAMWTKLRPGIWKFLEKASKLYELHLSTMGNKYYANEMAKLLDPNGQLFSGRVISLGDNGESLDGDERVPKIKDLEGVLGMESSVVIIDDSARVWPLNKLNLIVVERYIYFPCSRRQFGLPGPSLLEIDHDERPEDGTLAAASAVIARIHDNFFSHRSLNKADVRSILASEQRRILSGCRIVFSRVFPVGEANPHMHPLWQTAQQFGAFCANQIDDQVTHVVAVSLGTDKVNWALSKGKFVVHPGWVEASALLYRRANELDFAIKPQ